MDFVTNEITNMLFVVPCRCIRVFVAYLCYVARSKVTKFGTLDKIILIVTIMVAIYRNKMVCRFCLDRAMFYFSWFFLFFFFLYRDGRLHGRFY